MICRLLTWYYTLLANLPISGHHFGEPAYSIEGTFENETLTCLRCGAQSVAWRPM